MGTAIKSSVKILGVDMDGTLLATDALWESMLILLKKKPIMVLCFPMWLLKGKAFFKRQVAHQVELNPALLPYRNEVLSFLRVEKQSGKELVLTSASDEHIVKRVADHLGLFSAVLASDGITNLSGTNKLRALERYAGVNGFDYIGNSRHDLPLWRVAKQAILVAPSPWLLKKARRICSAEQVIVPKVTSLSALFRALRIHQWVKNVLLFVPLLMAHRITDIVLLLKVSLAFTAFSLCASSAYILNDLLDLETDRQHPSKRARPFASGSLQIPTGIVLALSLLAGALLTGALLLSSLFTGLLTSYFLMAMAYSLYFRHKLILDVLLLAGFYTLRILAGGIAASVIVSPWLLSFSMFLFLSLAFLKRYTELRLMEEQKKIHHSGRGYVLSDIVLVQTVGSTSGYLSVLVLALYINGREVLELYRHPWVLWFIGPCLLYWITRMWFLAHRGQMAHDPILFAVRDSKSYIVGLAVLILMVAATM
jgi:4-hydroxybenzoate polyprenyltransferase